MDGDLQSFAHPFSSGKDKGPYLGSPSWSGAVLGSGVPASPRFSDPWALEVSQPEKGTGPTGCRHGAGGALAPTPSLAGSSRPRGWGWGLAVPGHLGFELTLGCPLCAPHPGDLSFSQGEGLCANRLGDCRVAAWCLAVTVQAMVHPCGQHRS